MSHARRRDESMLTPVLATKLYVPAPPPNAVVRRRLVERIDEGLHRNLTLVSAPAGFGKTTFVSAWAAACERKVAWLSLDERDNDPARFLVHLVPAIQTIAPTVGETALALLQLPQPPPPESTLTALLNEVASMGDDLVVVLDDYHVIDAKPVDDTLRFLLEHLPQHMRLVIVTREDPQLPLARLRGRGQLSELRVADLRLSQSEAAAFLKQSMGLHL